LTAAPSGEKEDKETVLNLKNDFAIDYSKHENVYNKLREIREERLKGRKLAHHHAQLLAFMLESVKDVHQRVQVLLALLNATFTAAKSSTALNFLTRDAWVGAHNHMVSLLSLLEEDPIFKASVSTQ
jgi:hypothetical protein